MEENPSPLAVPRRDEYFSVFIVADEVLMKYMVKQDTEEPRITSPGIALRWEVNFSRLQAETKTTGFSR
jgi:hypothetical protein